MSESTGRPEPESFGRPSGRQEARLRRAWSLGRQEFGPLPLSFERFARRALELTLRRLELPPSETGDPRLSRALSRAAGADLFLAIACDEQIVGAWETLIERYVPRLKGVALRRGVPEPEAEELVTEIPGLLATPPPDGRARTRIGTFDGSGNLFCWLTVIVLRRLSDRGRASSRDEQARTVLSEKARPHTQGAASSVSDSEDARLLRAALERSWRILTGQERLTLLLKFRDGVRQDDIAALLGVGKSRVSRIVKRALVNLRKHVSVSIRGVSSDEQWLAFRRAVEEHMETLAVSNDQLT